MKGTGDLVCDAWDVMSLDFQIHDAYQPVELTSPTCDWDVLLRSRYLFVHYWQLVTYKLFVDEYLNVNRWGFIQVAHLCLSQKHANGDWL